MIEKIIVPTLERIPTRRWVNLGALVTMGVTHGLIEYFPARDGQAYVGDGGRAVEDALKEGWKLSPERVEGFAKASEARSLKWFCMRWTFAMVFRHIMLMDTPSDRYYMFLIDDFGMHRPFNEFQELSEFVRRDSHDMNAFANIIQLNVFDNFHHPKVERQHIPSIPSKVLVRGLSGLGDGGLIVNAGGAQVVYEEMCRANGRKNLEHVMWYMAQDSNQAGFYSISVPSYMIHWMRCPASVHEPIDIN